MRSGPSHDETVNASGDGCGGDGLRGCGYDYDDGGRSDGSVKRKKQHLRLERAQCLYSPKQRTDEQRSA